MQLEQALNQVSYLEREIQTIVERLGSEYFRDLPGAYGMSNLQLILHDNIHMHCNCHVDPQKNALIKIKISKSRLYKAKVGIVELKKRWDQRGTGRFRIIHFVHCLLLSLNVMVGARVKE